MAANSAGNGRELCSADLVGEMLEESIGPDNPMTDGAIAVAGVEVGVRLEGARRVLEDPTIKRDGHDTKALAALLLMDEEAGVFGGGQA
jgi:hypothetical protein